MLYKAVAKSVAGRYLAYAIGIVSLMILARIFAPEHFGVVAAAQVAFTLALLLAESGLGPAIISLDRLSAEDRDGIYSVTLLLGGSLAIILLLLADGIADLYQLADVGVVVPHLAVAVFFAGATIVPLAHLNRDKFFYWTGGADACGEAGATVAAVALLQVVDPLHALAARMPARMMIRWLISMWGSRGTEFGMPTPGAKLGAVRPLLGFSSFQLGFNFVNFFSRNLDSVLVGRFLGSVPLGIYDRAYQLMRYPLLLLTFAMNPAIQPVLRHHFSDVDHVEAVHRRFATQLAWLGVLAGLPLMTAAPWIVRVVLGPEWDGVVDVVRVLAVSVPVQIVLSTSGGFFQAMDRTGLLFLSGSLSAMTIVGALMIGIQTSSLVGLTWALVGAIHVNFFQAYWILYRGVFGRSPTLMFKRLIFQGLIIVAMVAWASGILTVR